MKITDKLVKVDNTFTVNKYDNGYMVEIGGRNSGDDWANVKIICNTLDDVVALLNEYDTVQMT